MSYSALVKNSVRSAFNNVGDLAVYVIMEKKATSGFNFSTMTAAISTISTITVKGIINNKIRNKDADVSNRNNKLNILFNKEDIGDISDYDNFTINGDKYLVEKPFKDDGYLIEATLVRGQ